MEITFTKRNKNNVNDAIERKKSYKKLSSEEWHQFLLNYNFDNGIEPFEWLVKQKICDKGTAMCLYWLLEPDFYYSKQKIDPMDESFMLITEIEKRVSEGYYENQQIAFDPRKLEITNTKKIEKIPSIMLEKTNGVYFERIDVEFAFLRNPNEKELIRIDKNIKDAILILQKTNLEFKHSAVLHTILEIEKCIAHWKGKDLGKMKIENLSYLWLDCLCEKYKWSWIIWDYETGKNFGVSNKSKSLTCLSDTIVKHTIDGYLPTSTFSELFNDLNEIEKLSEIKQFTYQGNGLLFSTDHLKFK